MLLGTIKVRKKYIKFHNSVLWHCRDDWYAARDVRQVTTKTPASPIHFILVGTNKLNNVYMAYLTKHTCNLTYHKGVNRTSQFKLFLNHSK